MLETLMRKLKPDRLVLTHLYTSRALPMEAMEKQHTGWQMAVRFKVYQM